MHSHPTGMIARDVSCTYEQAGMRNAPLRTTLENHGKEERLPFDK
jgi:hypothetical protein